jgi:hypothetical protein
MSKHTLLALGCLLVGFVFGISLGLFMGGGVSASDPSIKSANGSSYDSSSSLDAQTQVQANTLLSDRIRELEKELAEQKKNQDEALVSAGRIAFFKKYHDKIRISAFDGGFLVTPEMADILGLSKQEQELISKHLADIQVEMIKLNDANTTLVKQTANGATYEVPVDPQGKALKDQLSGLLSSDIGPDRADFFMNFGDFSQYSSFDNFAQSKKDIEITWAQQNGSLLYTIKNDYFGPNGVPSGSMSTTTTSLPPTYQKLLQGDSAPGP